MKTLFSLFYVGLIVILGGLLGICSFVQHVLRLWVAFQMMKTFNLL